MNDICRILEQINRDRKQRMALATIIRINGSSYRKTGAKMLFWENGQRYGTISAGCLEDDLFIHSIDVIKNNISKIVTYDLRDEEDIEWGVGCNGTIDVLIESVTFNPTLLKLKEHLFSGNPLLSVKPIKPGNLPENYLFTLSGNPLDRETEAELPFDVKEKVHELIHTCEKLKVADIKGEKYVIEKYEPKSYLYVFGAGNDAESLVRLASSLDFSVIVVDPRENRCNRDFFPTAEILITQHPDAFFQHHKLKNSAYIVIMNHHFQRDKQILEKLLYEQSAYIGILSSKTRAEKLLINIPDSIKNKIHYPIGLKIQAEGPDEISVSIMAELIQIRHQLMAARTL
ncbi:XdhC/CoxI family protein [Bacillus sp. FJAT-49736]|uniref:XdhC family protein n=1 Tax=Bacillus sp. FJAT-49736 TaxID=2833582 RepID=UPI001BC9A915|nr:XdhC/CoxI family protein [Bacillus sp. FJAT-49736]MBS4172356.1 XdhC family protein [Bacillus sp. FJAT-49736]